MSDLIQRRDEGNHNSKTSRFEYVPTYSVTDSESGQGSLDPKYLVSLILKYKFLIALFVILGGIGAWFYADTLTPVYRSSGTMIISANTSGDDELSRIISQTTGMGTSSTISNEIQVLKSREFARSIAVDLIDEDPGNHNEFPILWNVDEEGNVSRASEGAVAGRIRSGLTVNRLERDSEVIEITFDSPSSEEAAYISNKAMEHYVERSTQQNRRAAESTAQFLERERTDIKEKLDQAEERLNRYMDETGNVRIDEQASQLITQQTAVEGDIRQVQIELQSVNEGIQNYERQIDRLSPGLADQFSEAIGPRIRNMQEQLAQYEGERTLILTKNPNVREREEIPPRLKYLDEEIERVKTDIRELSSRLFSEDEEYMGIDSEERAQMVSESQTRLTELRIQKNQLESRINALQERREELNENLNSLPDGMMQLARLQRDVAINEELYLNVNQQYSEMSVLRQSQFGFGRIVDTAIPSNSPVSPNKKILLLLGIMLGGVLSAGIITVREFMDNSINNLDILKNSYLPLLSAVPVIDKSTRSKLKKSSKGGSKYSDDLIVLKDRSHLVSEAIRRLKNNLIYQNGEVPPQTVALTSAEKGDGKSTVVSNLAISFAEVGYKTLLIDTDFRRPKLHTNFGYENSAGLTDYLSGKISIKDLVKDTDINMLKFVSSGGKHEAPDTLVSSKKFNEFLTQMESVFDVIILDTPPFGIVSDSTALLKRVQTTVLVTKYRKTNRGVFQKTVEDLERIHANIGGVVVNGFDHRKEMSGGYGSGYYKAVYESYESYV